MNIPYVMKKCNKCGRWLVANTVNFYRDKNGKYGLVSRCKRCRAEYDSRHYFKNKDMYSENNKIWHNQNKEKHAKRSLNWSKTPKGQAYSIKKAEIRRSKEKCTGKGITGEQWLEVMNYFDWKCAYSGEKLTPKNRTIDHIIPITKNGCNEIWNMVPMSRSLNSSKNNKEMLSWYKQQDCFDEARLAKIYKWQEYAKAKYSK